MVLGVSVLSRPKVQGEPIREEHVQNKEVKAGRILEAQTNSEGSVSVEVTPIDVSEESELWKFKIALNTHSEELLQDLNKVVALNDKAPVSWDGPTPGGHHLEGTLSSRPISPRPEEILLIVREVGGVAERVFSWDFSR